MNAEQSRGAEITLPVFQIPRNLSDQTAVNVFNSVYKPRTFRLKSFKYFPQTGAFAAIGFDESGSQRYE